MGRPKMTKWTQDIPKATIGSTWTIFRSFQERFWHTKAAKTTVEQVCKNYS